MTNKIEEKKETRFTLRLPNSLIKLVDEERQKFLGKKSRTQWIIEAIEFCRRNRHDS